MYPSVIQHLAHPVSCFFQSRLHIPISADGCLNLPSCLHAGSTKSSQSCDRKASSSMTSPFTCSKLSRSALQRLVCHFCSAPRAQVDEGHPARPINDWLY